MRFSVWPSTGWTWDEILETAHFAESAGWDGVWLSDHFMPPERGYGNEPDPAADPELAPVHEGWALLAALAAAVPRVTLGVLVSGVSYRNPAVLAKMAATVDHVSDGRLILGIGAGWQENEHRRYGIEYPSPQERSDRLEEAAALITALTGPESRATFHGTHYRLDDAPLEPKPVQRPLPLLVGGGGERRTLRTAARYASHWNTWGTPETMRQKIAVLREHCRAIGRDPDEIAISTNAMFELVDDPAVGEERFEEMGNRGGLVGTEDQIRSRIDEYAATGVEEIVVAGFNHPARAFPEGLDRLKSIVGR